MEKALILYYSYTGHTRQRAQELAGYLSADTYEVKDKVRPGTFGAYTKGCFAALRQKPADVVPIAVDMQPYDTILLMAPVWAGRPAPPLHNMVAALPKGKKVEAWLVSGSGTSNARVKVATEVKKRGCELARYVDVGPSFNFDYFDTNPEG